MKNQPFEIIPAFRFTAINSLWDFNWDDKYVFNGETHSAWEIVYVVSGSVCATENENVYTLREGDMIIHAPMEFHTIRSADKTSPNVLVITLNAEGKLPKNLTNGILHLTEPVQEEYTELFKRIFNSYHSEKRDLLAGQECVDSLSSFLIRVNASNTAVTKRKMSRSAKEYKKILLSMVEHIRDNCSLEDFAAYNNISVSNIKVLFRKYSGTSPKLHYSRLRCNEAIKLMSEGMSAAETANILNFSSPNYFNTFFDECKSKTRRFYIIFCNY